MPFRSITSGFAATGTSTFDPGLPAGSVAGDVLIAFFTADGSGHGSILPAGFTVGHTDDVTNGDAQTVGWGWKKAVGSDVTNFTGLGASNFGCFIAAYSGEDTSGATPFDVTPSFNNPNSASVPNSPVSVVGLSVTTSIADDVVFLASVDTNGSNGTWSGSGLNNRASILSTDTFSAAAFFDFTQGAAGATGNQTAIWTQSGAAGNFTGYLIPLKGFSATTFPPVPGSPNVMPGIQQHNALMVS